MLPITQQHIQTTTTLTPQQTQQLTNQLQNTTTLQKINTLKNYPQLTTHQKTTIIITTKKEQHNTP